MILRYKLVGVLAIVFFWLVAMFYVNESSDNSVKILKTCRSVGIYTFLNGESIKCEIIVDK